MYDKTKKTIAMILTLIMASSMVTSCGDKAQQVSQPEIQEADTSLASESDESTQQTQAAQEETTQADDADTDMTTGGGSPWIDSDLKENITKDMDISLKDDFHLAVNHDWLLNNDIPEGYSSAGPFLDVSLEIQDKAMAVLEDESLTGHDAELIQSLYNAYLDWDARNEAGVEPVIPVVEDINSLDSIEAVSEFICDPVGRAMFVPTFLSVGNNTGIDDSSSYITCVEHDKFTLSDAAEYKNRTEYGDRYYSAYKKLSSAMLKRVGYAEDEAEAMFDRMIEFEGKLAEVSLTSEDRMQSDYIQKINNVMTLSEIEEIMPDFPIKEYIDACGYLDAKEFLVPEYKYLKRLNELYTEDNLDDIKNYMLVNYITGMAEKLDKEAFEQSIAAKNEISGSSGRLSDEKYAYNMVRGCLVEPMERAFIEKYDVSQKKEDITNICKDVISYYRTMLQDEEWMSDETKEKAIEKLDNIRINAVYPDKWKDYSGLLLTGLSYLDCVKKIAMFNVKEDQTHTNGKVDEEFWNCNTLETNAYYIPSENSINIMLGILSGDFYQDDMKVEEMYAGIGSVIAHEISHAFDTNGAQFDKDGNLADWWSEDDYAAFKERADKLVKYYDGITAFAGEKVRGANIQSEAIADMAGVKSLLAIANKKDNFDYKLFFEHYAKIWKRLSKREFEYMCLTKDVHPLHYLRTNVTVQQFDEFYDTFDIQSGDGMYLAPEDRINVW